jgi:hypothetical protein
VGNFGEVYVGSCRKPLFSSFRASRRRWAFVGFLKENTNLESLLFVWASGFCGPEAARKPKQTGPYCLVLCSRSGPLARFGIEARSFGVDCFLPLDFSISRFQFTARSGRSFSPSPIHVLLTNFIGFVLLALLRIRCRSQH